MLDPSKLFEPSRAHNIGHYIKLVKRKCHLEIRKFSFAYLE